MSPERRSGNQSFRSPESKAQLICGQAPSDYPEMAEFLADQSFHHPGPLILTPDKEPAKYPEQCQRQHNYSP